MSFSLYQAIIPTYLQILGATAKLLDKAEAHCESTGTAVETILQARIAEDMLPFASQVSFVAHHSRGAIEGVRKGVFSPDMTPPPENFNGLRAKISDARQALEALTEAEINIFIGEPMSFQMGDYRIDFVAENFLLSFSQPNFYFHAATAYNILRGKGLAIGKMDFMGQLQKLP